MKLPIFIFVVILKPGNSAETSVPVVLSAYKDFPLGITCDHFEEINVFDLGNDVEEYEYEANYPYDGEQAQGKNLLQCIIIRDGNTLFNETFAWEDMSTNGIFEIADDSWNNTKISIYVEWYSARKRHQSFLLTVKVVDGVEYDCSNILHERSKQTLEIGGERTFKCHGPREMYLSESQFNSITTVWYHGCEIIKRTDSEFEYEKVKFNNNTGDGVVFDRLKIRNASLSITPGKYQCVLKRGDKELVATSFQLCLKEHFKPNSPTIVASQENYKATLGSSINVSCFGCTGTSPKSIFQTVMWLKNVNGTWHPKCYNFLSRPSSDGNCTSKLHVNEKYCAPLSPDKISKVKNDYLGDNFTATLTLRDLTEKDHGLYACFLKTSKEGFQSNFTVTIGGSLEEKTNHLATVLSIVCGCIFIAIVLIVLFHFHKISILYFLEKCFPHHETMDRKYVSYLVYTADIFKNMKVNMLQDTVQYFKSLNQPVYDPNNKEEHSGALLAKNVLQTLSQCKTVVLFLTPQLLTKQDEAGIEMYEVYYALENNIENLDVKLIFICLKETKKAIKTQAINGNKFCVLLQRFMRRQENSVIIWKPRNRRAFHHALYVAMSKVKINTILPNTDAV